MKTIACIGLILTAGFAAVSGATAAPTEKLGTVSFANTLFRGGAAAAAARRRLAPLVLVERGRHGHWRVLNHNRALGSGIAWYRFRLVGRETAYARIRWQTDRLLQQIVSGWPPALSRRALGFTADPDIDAVVRALSKTTWKCKKALT